MNKRDFKQFGKDEHYHLYNRGNALQEIFLDQEDYKFFILKLKQNIFPHNASKRMRLLPANSFSLLSYCLMPNHFHLLLKQNGKYTPSQLLLRICSSYSKYFNRKYNKVGHVFQDKYKQVNIEDDDQLLWMLAYINLNPVIDEKVLRPEVYKWSSCKELIEKSGGLCDKSFITERFHNPNEFTKFIKDALPVLKINKNLRKFKL